MLPEAGATLLEVTTVDNPDAVVYSRLYILPRSAKP